MSARWLSCPHCQVRFQTVMNGAIRCPACNNSFVEPASIAPSLSWYVVQNKQKVGPLTNAQMQQMSLSGQLRPDDMVLQEGTKTWMPAAKVGSLFGGETMAPAAKVPTQDTLDESRRT